jgi:hypothetical protein
MIKKEIEKEKIRDNLFREYVSKEIVGEILKLLNFDGVTDSRFFTIRDIDVSKFEMAVIILEPYYIPCKAKKYLYGILSVHRILTILRQILKPIGFTLYGQERTIGRKKETIYQIIQTEFEKEISTEMKITFD